MKRTTRKRLFYLLLLFLILFAGYKISNSSFFTKFFQKKPKIFPFKKEDIVQITFVFEKSKKQTVVKKEDSWIVKEKEGEYPADKQRIESLLDFFASLTKEEIVSKNQKKHKEFGIGEKRIEVKVKDGKSFVLFIGNPAGLQKYYARVDNEPQVFVVQGLELYPEDLRDLRLQLVKEQTIKKVAIKYNNSLVLLSKENNDWQVNSKKADKSKVDFFLSDLNALKGEDIKKEEDLSLKNPFLTLEVETDKEKKRLFIYRLSEQYWAKIEKRKFVYKLSESTLEQLQKKEEDFLP